MSNFFAALDDSGDEGSPEIKKATVKKAPPPKTSAVAEPSKVNNRSRRNDDRNTKTGRGGRHARDGKRAYDRRSGTGRGREMKKGGGGAHNWGSDKNDARAAEHEATASSTEEKAPTAEGETDGAVEETKENGEGKAESNKKEDAAVVEEEDNTISYEEYIAAKKSEVPESEFFKPLVTKQLDDVDDFAGKALVRSKDENFLVMGGGKAPKKKGKPKAEKQTIVAGFRTGGRGGGERSDRRGGGRGGGDRRGGRGRDRNRNDSGAGSRSQKKQGADVDVADTLSFPSLG